MANCCWVISPNKFADGKFTPAVYCGKKTSFRIVKDDDGNKVRKYENFCDSHLEESNTISAESLTEDSDWDI